MFVVKVVEDDPYFECYAYDQTLAKNKTDYVGDH